MKKLFTVFIATLLMISSCCIFSACNNPSESTNPTGQTEIKYEAQTSQFNALTALVTDSANVAVVDSSFYSFYVGKNLISGVNVVENTLTSSKTKNYSFSTRKDSNIPTYINAALYKLQQDGILAELAENYCLSDNLATIPEPEILFENLPTPEKGSDWANVIDRGYLVIGYTLNESGADNNNPFVARGQTYLADNFEPKLLAQISKLFGLDYDEYYNSDDYGLKLTSLLSCTEVNQFLKLEAGDCDMLMNRMNPVDFANQNVDYTTPFINDKLVVVVKGTAPSFDSLKDKKFTASKDTIAETFVKNDINNYFFD